MARLVECVPNISEGRNKTVIDQIVAAAAVGQVQVLDIDAGAATNRTVITLAGSPEEILESVFQLIKKASELIDMRKHSGEHPRIGATDVVPFIPLENVTMQECVELARRLGERVASELSIPVYLYEEAASSEERRSLAYLRSGEYESLAQKLNDPKMQPDFGQPRVNEKSGLTIIGARPFLIAYNFNLNTRDKKLANEIAIRLRESGYKKKDENGKFVRANDGNPLVEPGMFQCCRAVGWYIEEYGIAQISINFTNFNITPIHTVFDAACELASKMGLRVTGSELVGLIPKAALLMAGEHYLRKQGATSAVSEKLLLDAAVKSLGLAELGPFKLEEKIIEERVKSKDKLMSLNVSDFVELVASDAPAPGGGSVSALAGALAGALSAMVAALSFSKAKLKDNKGKAKLEELGKAAQVLKERLCASVSEDTLAFEKVVQAFRLKAATPAEEQAKEHSVFDAYSLATQVPLRVCQACLEVTKVARELLEVGMQSALSDAAVALEMGQAAFLGASYNVRINLKELKAKAEKGPKERSKFVESTSAQLQKLTEELEQVVEGGRKKVRVELL